MKHPRTFLSQQTKLHAFTLVELSIVLVIIGLLVGAILVGQNLVRTAQLRSIISDIDSFKAAAHNFKMKYNCLPGDCATASSLFTGTTNGDGNGRVASFRGTLAERIEMFQAWHQLGAAGLITGGYTGTQGPAGTIHCVPGTNVPASKLGNSTGYTLLYWSTAFTDAQDWSPCVECNISAHIIFYGSSVSNTYETYGNSLTPSSAYDIDSKADNGKPGSGSIIVFQPHALTGCTSNIDPTTATYSPLSSTNITCNLMFINPF